MKFIQVSRWQDGEEIVINTDHIILIELYSVLGKNQEYINLTKLVINVIGEQIITEDIEYVLELIKK
jgi:hypothetical protein